MSATSSTARLAGAFREALKKPLELSDEVLRSRLQSLYEAGCAAWPSLELTPVQFARYLGERAATVSDVMGWLSRAHGDGLYLACGCLQGSAIALASFERSLLERVPDWLARLRLAPALVDEVRQRVRVKLFVAAPGARPKIADYSGEGALAAWLRAVAQREALTLLRSKDPLALEEDDATIAAAIDPELAVIGQSHRTELARAFRAALASLPAETRNLLRFHYLDGLSIDRLAPIIGVHSANAAKRLQRAREAILEETRRQLQSRLKLRDTEIDSFLRQLDSRLDVSLASALGGTPSPQPK